MESNDVESQSLTDFIESMQTDSVSLNTMYNKLCEVRSINTVEVSEAIHDIMHSFTEEFETASKSLQDILERRQEELNSAERQEARKREEDEARQRKEEARQRAQKKEQKEMEEAEAALRIKVEQYNQLKARIEEKWKQRP